MTNYSEINRNKVSDVLKIYGKRAMLEYLRPLANVMHQNEERFGKAACMSSGQLRLVATQKQIRKDESTLERYNTN